MKKIGFQLFLTFFVTGSTLINLCPASAQSVVFPQKIQAGVATSTATSDTYTLKNDLLSASFVKKDGTLVFGGCKAMNLEAGSELFKIILGDGTTIPASQMALQKVALVNLTPDESAAKASLRIPGKAIEASFNYGALSIIWRAVLRNESHYLRTEMSITANSDQAMTAIYPMLYNVNTAEAKSAPIVVGNTRGAIIASDEFFAGVETPTGINTVESPTVGENFNAHSWNEKSFAEQLGEGTPQGVLTLGFKPDEVVAARGYLSFTQAGTNTLSFNYKSGQHKLNIVGVDALDANTEQVVAHDYHIGATGNAHTDNIYTLNLPRRGVYLLRYFVQSRDEAIDSQGDVLFSQKVKQPVVIYDLTASTDGSIPAMSLVPATPMRQSKKSMPMISEDESLNASWTSSTWKTVKQVPLRINELGFYNPQVKGMEQEIGITARHGVFSVEFLQTSGSNSLNTVGIDLVDTNGNVVTYDYHVGHTGEPNENSTYTVNIPYAGQYKLRYFAETKSNKINSEGNININLTVTDTLHLAAATSTPIVGKWSRNTTLKVGKTWNVSSVVGLIAKGQSRRSVLAYSERERAVPWRPYPVYISWYELNIDRNNATAPTYEGNMTVKQCANVVRNWKKNFYDKYGIAPKAFVWDDGWDEYGTWKFNCNFPNGFKEPATEAAKMHAGIGAWLGPVGGYGQSGQYRRKYWTDKGSRMELSNDAYYDFFVDACRYMVKTYDFRFFKYDGISAQFSAVGPDPGSRGEENAEAIINIECDLRSTKPDLFLNTTVGTWASPFWFQFTDAVWRQEQDYGEIGDQGTDREKWITYRDRLVYQNFVQRSPLCPINTLMTHGFILSKFGQVSKNMDYDGIVREMRCAFACGSSMVELYNDYELMNSIPDAAGRKGMLWKELADCMKWQEANADVLPDVHWVGGNPWDGTNANIYGWAAWNGQKAVLTLRNPAAKPQTISLTLRKALDIPSFIKTTVTLSNAFEQSALSGLPCDKAIDIDELLTLTLPASSVSIFNGVDNAPVISIK